MLQERVSEPETLGPEPLTLGTQEEDVRVSLFIGISLPYWASVEGGFIYIYIYIYTHIYIYKYGIPLF